MRTRMLILCIVVLPVMVFAGNPPGGEDDILRPVPWRFHAGPYGGAAYVLSSGNFRTLCDCEYGSGSGLGLQIGGFIDYPIAPTISILGTLGYRLLHPTYEKSQRRLEYVPDASGGRFEWVDFELNTALSLSLVELGAAVKWDLPLRGLYVAVGPEIGVVIADNIEEVEHIQTPGYTYDNSGRTDQTFMDDALDTYYSDPLAIRLGVAGRLGYIVPIHERMSIAPELMMSIPLTPVTSTYSDWRLSAWQFNVYLRFAI